METVGFVLSLQPVLQAISTSIEGFRNIPAAFVEFGKVINVFQQLLSSFEKDITKQEEFPWVHPLKESLEEALEAIENFKIHPLKTRLYSSSYLKKIENVKKKIHEAVNATALTNAHLALQARNALTNLSNEINNLSVENEKFQLDLKHALQENKADLLQSLAEMLGMSNQYELRQKVIDAVKVKNEALSALSDQKNSLFERDQTIAIELSRLAITKMEECPDEFKCPITRELMEKPILLVQSGHDHSYEYEALLKALAAKQGKDPLTNKPFQGTPQFVENHNLRQQIQDWKDKNKTKIKTMQSFQSQTTTNQNVIDPNPDNRFFFRKSHCKKLSKKKLRSIIMVIFLIVIMAIVLPFTLDFNLQKQDEYPDCNVENIGWINDTICNGGDYASDECGNDGGDCENCFAENIALMLFGDGFCDEINNVDGCSFDGNDCVPSMRLIGDKYDSGGWNGGVVGHDGNIYGIPDDMNKILKIDPSPNATNPTALVGDDLGLGRWKWFGGVVGNNSIIYGVPYVARSILSYNLMTEETKLIADPLLGLRFRFTSTLKFAGGVLANNGMIYFIPFFYNKVIKFDPSNLEDPLTEIGDDLGDDLDKMVGGVLGSDGNIYAIPSSESKVLKIDVTDDSTTFISDDYSGNQKWYNGVLAQDGNIYACPFNANQILQINFQNQTTMLVGPILSSDGRKWSGFVEGEDGFLYGIPYASNELLRFDPINHTATLIPLPEEWHGEEKWEGGVRADNGFIYAIPYGAEQVLSIAPLKFRP